MKERQTATGGQREEVEGEKQSKAHGQVRRSQKNTFFLSAGWESELMHRHRLALANKLVKVRDSEDQK